jgi:hypothetical protein
MDLVKNISLDEKFSFTGKAKSKIITLIIAGAVLAVIGFVLLQIDSGHGHGHEAHAGGDHKTAAKEALVEVTDEVTAVEQKDSHGHVEEVIVAKETITAVEPIKAEEHAHHGKPVWAKRIIKDIWQNNVFFGGIALIGVFFLAFNYVAYAGWSALIKRVPEAFGYYLPVFAVLTFILIGLFGHDIFHWMDSSLYKEFLEDGKTLNPHYDEIISSKTWWLSTFSFWVRIIIYFVLWIFFWYTLRKKSMQEDISGGISFYDRSIVWSAGFLVIFGVTSSTSAWDLVMSMDPHFFSTMFGWYVFASWLVSGFSMITIIVITLKENGYLKMVNENHLHDLGKFMFAFSIFWTYIWFEQFLLIYYSNIPEESYYFIERLLNGTYKPLFFLTFFINFIFPFIVLMTRNAKRQMIILKIVAIFILVGHWLDFFMMMTPPMLHNDGGFDYKFFFLELGITMVFLGFFLYAVLTGLSKAGLIAKNHPMIEESIHHHVY